MKTVTRQIVIGDDFALVATFGRSIVGSTFVATITDDVGTSLNCDISVDTGTKRVTVALDRTATSTLVSGPYKGQFSETNASDAKTTWFAIAGKVVEP